eukprot:818446-Rhodomonas_salina.1
MKRRQHTRSQYRIRHTEAVAPYTGSVPHTAQRTRSTTHTLSTQRTRSTIPYIGMHFAVLKGGVALTTLYTRSNARCARLPPFASSVPTSAYAHIRSLSTAVDHYWMYGTAVQAKMTAQASTVLDMA